jgi:hypothetical protein
LTLIVAIVVLEIVDTLTGEELVILGFVTQRAGIPAAGEDTGRTVHAKHHSERVNLIGDVGHTIKELLRVWHKVATGVATFGLTIVKNNIFVAKVSKTIISHSMGCAKENRFVDVAAIGLSTEMIELGSNLLHPRPYDHTLSQPIAGVRAKPL